MVSIKLRDIDVLTAKVALTYGYKKCPCGIEDKKLLSCRYTL